MSDQQDRSSDFIGSELVRQDASFANIVAEFVEGLSARLTQMESEIRSGDLEALRLAAHQLKGSGGGYGYPMLTQQAAILEQHAKSGALDSCIEALGELKSLCERVVVETDGTAG